MIARWLQSQGKPMRGTGSSAPVREEATQTAASIEMAILRIVAA